MSTHTTGSADFALQLPAATYYQLLHTLRRSLPPPLTDSPEDLRRRDQAAIARIAALSPGSPAEAETAALHVAASEQWRDCLRLVNHPDTTPERATKCLAQANAMMRQAQSALRLLVRLQDAREKRDANNDACERAAWMEHLALSLMAEALDSQAPPATAEPPSQTSSPCGNGEEGTALTAAEQYAAIYPQRAALIRRLGRVPDNPSFDPPDDDLVQALIASEATAPAVSFHDPSSHVPRDETAMKIGPMAWAELR